MTFSIYDSPKMTDTDSGSTNTYQPRHEEGNFFSYPSGVEGIDGYTKNGALANEKWIGWSKGSSTGTTIEFSKANIASNSYEDKIQESEMNKTVSALASLFGADDPNPLPPYTGHSETFTKSLETAEAISIKLYGKSTIPGEEAGHRILSMPFVAREGTLKVGHAVELLQNAQSRLWAPGGRYKTYADPSLVLHHKFTRSGSNLVADTNNFSAMQMRGLRFYVPDTDQYSDTHLVAGLTYEIRVPIYNASFVRANNVKVKLSYIKNTDFKGLRFNETLAQLKTTMNSLKEIGTETVATLGGWPDNKKWVTFKWTVPQDAANAEYVLFAQIDPAGGITEGHESRLNYSTGDIVDYGGNNEGYFVFNITSMAEARRKHAKAAAIMAGELKPGHSDGVVYGAFYQKGVGAIGGGNINAASNTLDKTGSISADVKLVGLEESGAPIDTVDFMMLLGVLSEMADVSEDAIAQMEFSVTYDGDEYYPKVYLQGVNFKEGVRDQVEERGYPVRDEIESMFAVHRMALVPHTTTHFTMTLTPRTIGFKNGAGFEFYVPELAATSVLAEIAESTAEAETSSEEPSGEDPSGEDPGTETPTAGTLGSSGGGCETFGLGLLGLAALAFIQRKNH
ncbi:MAG: hypothetical protein IJS39_00890 [Synergistaceae bacterium]|nr:hypothetical protein [Synergistaceae bacterium]